MIRAAALKLAEKLARTIGVDFEIVQVSEAGYHELTVRTEWGALTATWQTYSRIDAVHAWRDWFKQNGFAAEAGARFPSAEDITEAFVRESQRPAWSAWQDVVDKSRRDGDPEAASAYVESMQDIEDERIVSPDDLHDLRSLVELPRAKA